MRKIILTVACLYFVFSCKESIKKEKTVVEEQIVKNELVNSTEANAFWDALQALCGNAFEGTLELPENDPDFGGKQLVMHIRTCEDNIIRIPFFVGDDKSRTWVLTFEDDRIQLKHDHRHEDGSEDDVNMYGGKTTNSGQATIQTFPADQHTKTIIPAASTNIWWITLDDNQFTYNLRRLGTERVFRVSFDLTKTIETPEAPWGWKD
jgi:hypothetical protein